MRLAFLLWLALLCFGLPEVFAGSGKGWLTRPDVYILSGPLYILHFLLLCHIAIKTRRTSWPALYLWGVVFGLYESWITKVIWNGYPGSGGFIMSSFGDWFGVHETLGLVLFYHPVTSFLLPLAVATRLFPAFGRHFPAPDWVFGTTRWGLARRVALVAMWGLISGHNTPVVTEYLYTWVPMLILLWLGYIVLRSRINSVNSSPVLGRFGLWVAGFWLALIYLASTFLLLPEKLPPVHIQAITLALYLVVFLLIKRTPIREASPTDPLPPATAKGMFGMLMAIFLTGLLTSAAIGSGISLALVVAVVPLIAMVLLGVVLFIWLALWKTLIRPQPSA